MADEDSEELETMDGEGSNRVAWFITGAIIGTTVALLYAPKSGKATRQYLSDKTQQGKSAVTDTGRDIVDSSRELFDRGRKVVEDAADLFERARKLVRG